MEASCEYLLIALQSFFTRSVDQVERIRTLSNRARQLRRNVEIFMGESFWFGRLEKVYQNDVFS